MPTVLAEVYQCETVHAAGTLRKRPALLLATVQKLRWMHQTMLHTEEANESHGKFKKAHYRQNSAVQAGHRESASRQILWKAFEPFMLNIPTNIQRRCLLSNSRCLQRQYAGYSRASGDPTTRRKREDVSGGINVGSTFGVR